MLKHKYIFVYLPQIEFILKSKITIMKGDKSAVKSLFDNLKTTLKDPIDTPIQTVTPLKKSTLANETRFTIHVPVDRLRNLKLKAAQEGVTMKELVNKAIVNQYGI